MNAKQMKKTRHAAYEEAERRKLWNIGSESIRKSLYKSWWRRLVARIFRKVRARDEALIAELTGHWYEATIKRWAHRAIAYAHDPDFQALTVARRQAARKRRIERAKK